jgi:hypothetical protein
MSLYLVESANRPAMFMVVQNSTAAAVPKGDVHIMALVVDGMTKEYFEQLLANTRKIGKDCILYVYAADVKCTDDEKPAEGTKQGGFANKDDICRPVLIKKFGDEATNGKNGAWIHYYTRPEVTDQDLQMLSAHCHVWRRVTVKGAKAQAAKLKGNVSGTAYKLLNEIAGVTEAK